MRIATRVQGKGWPSRLRSSCFAMARCLQLRYLALVALGGLVAVWGLVDRRFRLHWGREDTCEAYLGGPIDRPFSLILTADPGEFSGTPEAHYILANLRDKRSKLPGTTVCASHYHGTLMGQPVMVVTTGIGPPAASVCTLEVVMACGSHIKEILYFGTSGWSPQLGGVLNPPKCNAANKNQLTTRIGDVCVSPFSVNWTCKKSSWAQQAAGYPNQCYRPPEAASPNATILYGNCQFYADNMEANLQLATEVLAVARSRAARSNVPTRSHAVTGIEQQYWQMMANATGVSYPLPAHDNPPTYWNYTQCMEVDGQYFFSGVPFEVKARDYAADTLTAALGEHKTSADVIAVSAMEGIGVAEALLKYHSLITTKRSIPYTNIRTLSNWLHQPMAQVKPGVWQQQGELPEDFVTGYGYAIATGSATLLSLYQRRCKQEALRQPAAGRVDCNFVIKYTSEATAGSGVPDAWEPVTAAAAQQGKPTKAVRGSLLRSKGIIQESSVKKRGVSQHQTSVSRRRT